MNEPQVNRQLSAWCAPTSGIVCITLPLMCSSTTQRHWHIGGCGSFTNSKSFTVEQSYVTATKGLLLLCWITENVKADLLNKAAGNVLLLAFVF